MKRTRGGAALARAGQKWFWGYPLKGAPSSAGPGDWRGWKNSSLLCQSKTRVLGTDACGALRAARASGPTVPGTTRAIAGPLGLAGASGSRTFAQGRRRSGGAGRPRRQARSSFRCLEASAGQPLPLSSTLLGPRPAFPAFRATHSSPPNPLTHLSTFQGQGLPPFRPWADGVVREPVHACGTRTGAGHRLSALPSPGQAARAPGVARVLLRSKMSRVKCPLCPSLDLEGKARTARTFRGIRPAAAASSPSPTNFDQPY